MTAPDREQWPLNLDDLGPQERKLIEATRTPLQPGDPRRHHFVPRFLLRKFAKEGVITRISLRDPSERHTGSVEDVAVVKDFYTIIDDEIGETVSVEKMIAVIDGAAAKPLARLTLGMLFPPQPQDRADLAMWFSSLHFRGPQMRRKSEALTDLSMKMQMSLLEHEGNARAHLRGRLEREPTADEIAEVQGAAESIDEFEVVAHQNEHIKLMLDMMTKCFPFFACRHWTVLKFDEPGLFLSDRPIVLYSYPENRGPMSGQGVGNADEIWLALDRETALVMHRDEVVGDSVMRDQLGVDNFNQSVVVAGATEIYCHPDDAYRLDRLNLPDDDQPLIMMSGAKGWVAPSTDGVNSPPERQRPMRYRRDEIA